MNVHNFVKRVVSSWLASCFAGRIKMSARRKFATAIILALLILLTANYQSAKAWTLWYVAPGGNNSWDCLSATTACRTIQAAINKASVGDSVRVEAGTYSAATNGETFPITIGKSLTIFGASSATTIIDATGSGQNVISAAGNNIEADISYFTIQGGNRGIEHIGYYPGYIGGQIAYNKITGNSIGIYTDDSRADIKNNDISGNTNSGILNEYSSPAVFQNILGWNGSGGSDAAIHNDHSDVSIVNNVMGWNNGSGVFNTNSSPIITNNSIAFNYGGSGIANFDSSSPQITNNIITANAVYGIHADVTSSPVNSYNDVWANAWGQYYGPGGGTGSMAKDPRFVSWFDAHLLCSSPAINKGDNNAPNVPSVDYDNNPRPAGGRVDMGAIEKQSDLYCPVYLPVIKK